AEDDAELVPAAPRPGAGDGGDPEPALASTEGPPLLDGYVEPVADERLDPDRHREEVARDGGEPLGVPRSRRQPPGVEQLGAVGRRPAWRCGQAGGGAARPGGGGRWRTRRRWRSGPRPAATCPRSAARWPSSGSRAGAGDDGRGPGSARTSCRRRRGPDRRRI